MLLVLGEEVAAQMTAKVAIFLRKHCDKKVTIALNTEGGDTQQAIEICSMIQAHGNVTVYAFGECASAGTLILCSAKHRHSTPTCVFTVHYGEEVNTSLNDVKRNKQMLKWMRELYKQRTSVGARTVNKWLSQDTVMNADRALKVGLIDNIQEFI